MAIDEGGEVDSWDWQLSSEEALFDPRDVRPTIGETTSKMPMPEVKNGGEQTIRGERVLPVEQPSVKPLEGKVEIPARASETTSKIPMPEVKSGNEILSRERESEERETVDSAAIATEKLEVAQGLPVLANGNAGDKILNAVNQISDAKMTVSTNTIAKIGIEIIERLMVVQAVDTAKQEVVIVFKESVLPGTQVSLVREKSELSLTFTTANNHSMDLLTTGHDGLRNFLLDQLKDISTVHIKFEEKGYGDSGEKNSQKRQQNQHSEEEQNRQQDQRD
jgi:hypothetical protein